MTKSIKAAIIAVSAVAVTTAAVAGITIALQKDSPTRQPENAQVLTDNLPADSELGEIVEWNGISVREPIVAGNTVAAAINKDGTVTVTGNEIFEEKTTGWKNIVDLAVTDYHIIGLKADGTVVVATEDDGNENNMCDAENWTDITAIAAAENYIIVGLKADGTVVTTGYNVNGQSNVGEWTDIVDIAAGEYHTVGLKADGTVVATEYIDEAEDDFTYYHGECEVDDWSDVVAIGAGRGYTLGLKADGTVLSTDYEHTDESEVGDWTDIVAISTGGTHTLGLKADGTVVSTEFFGNPESEEAMYETQFDDVEDFTDVVAVASGSWFTLVLKADGSIETVGLAYEGIDFTKLNNVKMP